MTELCFFTHKEMGPEWWRDLFQLYGQGGPRTLASLPSSFPYTATVHTTSCKALFAHGSLSSFGFYFVFCFVGVLYGWVFFCFCFCFWWLEWGAGWGGCLSSFNILVEELAALEPEPRSVGPQSHELTLWGAPKAQVRPMLLFTSVPQPWFQLVLQVISISWEGVSPPYFSA